LPYRRRDS